MAPLGKTVCPYHRHHWASPMNFSASYYSTIKSYSGLHRHILGIEYLPQETPAVSWGLSN